MNKNFEIGQSNEIIKSGKVYDLHNSYDFVGIVLKTSVRKLEVLFEPNSEYGNNELPILLCFEEIDYLEFSPNFGASAVSGLDEMGYKNPDEPDDEWLMSENQSTSNDHLFFRLDGGGFIRVHCKKANLLEARE